ncbi:hypothetical protein IK112_00295, partial [Candidatus Saccharibacteria bacterium]|nr:hypothetical protein [Candidatus Saccharibacteria bacterium]
SGAYLWNGGALNYQSSFGFSWSATALNNSNANPLSMDSSFLISQNNNYPKIYGLPLRCVSL